MIKDALEFLKKQFLQAEGKEEINGLFYSHGRFYLIEDPMAKALEVHTLTALATYLDSEMPETKAISEGEGKIIIHVESPDSVMVSHELTDKTRQREYLMKAQRYGDIFQFGTFMSQEDFSIALQSRFMQTDIRDQLLKIAGNVMDEIAKTSKDDGVTQEITARAGVARLEQIELPNPVTLQPHRTFPEVDQPESQFIFRIHSQGQGVGFALFGADNENWKLEAIKNVAAWLKENVKREDVILLS